MLAPSASTWAGPSGACRTVEIWTQTSFAWRRAARSVVATLIRGDDMEVVFERRHQIAPGVPGFRESVQHQQQRRPGRSRLRIVEADRLAATGPVVVVGCASTEIGEMPVGDRHGRFRFATPGL